MIAQGLELMLVGMGVVFFVLGALTAITAALSRTVGFWHRPSRAGAAEDESIAAVAAAVRHHRALGRGDGRWR